MPVRVASTLRLESIKSRIIVLALLATVIPYVGMAWFTYAQNKSAITIEVEEELRTLSSQAAREADIWMRQRIYDLGVFANSSAVVGNVRIATDSTEAADGARGLVRDYLESVRQRVRGYDELRIVDTLSQVVASSGDDTVDPTLPEGWLAAHQDNRPALGEPYRSASFRSDLISVGVPIRSPTGQLLGGFFATLNLEAMGTVLGAYSPGETGSLYVVTRASKRVFGSQGTAGSTDTTSMDAAARARIVEQLMAEGSPALTYVGDSGSEVTGAARSVGDLGWSVVAEVPASEPYQRIVRLRNLTLFGVSAMLLVVGLVAYRVGHLIVRPLDRLMEGAAGVARGDLAVDLPVMGRGEVGVLTEVFNHMVARLRSTREQLEQLLVTDGLTGLFNRRHLMTLLADEMHRCHRNERPFSILMIDVDHFKKFNDTYGHLAGDEALTTVASVLTDCTRQVDRVARYGVDHGGFGVDGLHAPGRPRCPLRGGRVRGAPSEHGASTEKVGKVKASVTVSTGVAELPAHSEDPGELMAAADAALYKAKRGGRDRIVSAVTPETASTPRKTGAERRAKASTPKEKAKARTAKKASPRKKAGTPK